MIHTFDNSTSVIIPKSEYDRLLQLTNNTNQKLIESTKPNKKYAYGMAGIGAIFNCSIATANRIKASGKIDKAIIQIGRKIVVDIDMALELAAQKNGGRR